MTIQSQTRTAGPFVGTGATVPYPFNFKVFQSTDILVVRTNPDGSETTLTMAAEYNVTLNSDQETAPGGIVQLVDGLPTGYIVFITSAIPELQKVLLTNQGGFYPRVISDALDYLTILVQQLRGPVSRSLKLPISDSLMSTTLPTAQERANTLLGFDSLGRPAVTAPGSDSAAGVGLALSTFIGNLFSSAGSTLMGYIYSVTGSVRRTVQARLRDTMHVTDFGVVGNWNGTTGTNDTVAVQTAFTRCEQNTKPLFLPMLSMLVDPITMGDPATADIFFPSGQAAGAYSVQGESRLLTTFYASAACAGKTVIGRNNLSGVTFRGFGAEGRGIASTGIDLSWVYKNNIAPSSQNIIEDLQATNCTVIGINLDGMHDSKIAGIRTAGSPIGISLCGGGGQLSLSNSAISGLLKCSGQNIEISQSVALSGMDIDGNTDNRIRVSGTQVFPIASISQVSSNKWGFSLATQDSGAYGANMVLDTSYFFGGTSGCFVGKYVGVIANNCVFDWAGGFFFGLTTSGSSVPPVFEFNHCEFRGTFASGPTMVLPTVGSVILRNCFVAGVYYEYFNSAEEFFFTPTLASTGNPLGTGNTYNFQYGRARVTGNVVHHFLDVSLATVGTHSGAVIIGNLVKTPNDQAVGSGVIALASGLTFPTGCSQLGIVPQANSQVAALFGFGNNAGPVAVDGATLNSSSRIYATITTRRS